MSTILKCKMCGGDIEVNADMSVGTCQYCGSIMTLPHIDDDKKARIFNRANEYRLNNEFDKAYRAYDAIVNDDTEEAEAYWGLVLCEYGIEYVEDPATHRRIPTCHRTKAQSVFDNVNYQMAYKYADAERKMLYHDDAEVIDKIQRKILSVSNLVEPYDVFICYKETNELGERTNDSVLAQDIYTELTRNNIRAFFARISLEDKLGCDYEPYIYAALKSAKVMLVVTTSGEHCEAVWVKNEWMRYLSFMEEDISKNIIPVYREMYPDELPRELAKFQAQNMDKIGAIQDLVHGVLKLVNSEAKAQNNEKLRQVISDYENREASKNKTKKLIKKIAIIAACIVLIITIPFGGYKLFMAIKSTTVTSGIPDSDKYYFFTVKLTKDNWNEYLDIYYNHDMGGVDCFSNAYEEGWYVWDTTAEILFSEDSIVVPFRGYVGYLGEMNYFDNPAQKVSGEIIFVSKEYVKDVYFDDVENSRCIVLKDGRSKTIINPNVSEDIMY